MALINRKCCIFCNTHRSFTHTGPEILSAKKNKWRPHVVPHKPQATDYQLLRYHHNSKTYYTYAKGLDHPVGIAKDLNSLNLVKKGIYWIKKVADLSKFAQAFSLKKKPATQAVRINSNFSTVAWHMYLTLDSLVTAGETHSLKPRLLMWASSSRRLQADVTRP